MDAASEHAETRMMFCRVSPEDQILYCNAALARYLGVDKDVLIGAQLDAISERLGGEIAQFFSRQSVTGSLNRLITDSEGRIFEASRSSDGMVLDLVLTEVTEVESLVAAFRGVLPPEHSELGEDELRSLLQGGRCIVSITRTRACGLDELAPNLAALENRLLLQTLHEELRDALWAAGGCCGDSNATQTEGLFGVPWDYRDHGLRALQAVFNQFENFALVRKRLHRVGKQLPALSAGISAGDVLVAPLFSDGIPRITASGPPTLLCEKLCRLARPGEILVGQFALTCMFSNLPAGWSFQSAEMDDDPDLSGLNYEVGEVLELPEALRRKALILGVGLDAENPAEAFYFEYLYLVNCAGYDSPVPVLRVRRNESSRAMLTLRDDRLLRSPVVQVLGQYKLMEVVGVGGMGKVWKAQDRYGNIVAIKVLNPREAASEESVRRFQREAEIMMRLPHKNICRVFEIGEFDNVRFICMEYVEGLTLADLLYEGMDDSRSPVVGKDTRLTDLIQSLRTSRNVATSRGEQPIAETSRRPRRSRILPIAQTLSLFTKICEAVQFAHDHGILHRDLKPGNVLLREDGEPLVADFGLAKLDEENETSFSVTGNIVGTIENMSPEQAESSKDVDERADVYSLGTILYQMLTGHRHFESSGNIHQDAETLKHHAPKPLRQLNPALDPDLELICLKALRADPRERYRTVAALLADITRYRRGEAISARPVRTADLLRKSFRRHKAVFTTSAVALLLLAAFGVAGLIMINEKRIEAERHARLAREQAERAELEAQRAEALRKETELARREAEANLARYEAEAQERRRLEEEKEEEQRQRELLEKQLAQRAQQTGDQKEAIATAARDEAPAQVNDFPPVQTEGAPFADSRFAQEADALAARAFASACDLAAAIVDSDRNVISGGFTETPELPDTTYLRNQLATLLQDGLNYSSAAILANPENPKPWMHRGFFALSLHDPKVALESLHRASELSWDNERTPEILRLLHSEVEEHVRSNGVIVAPVLERSLGRYPIPEFRHLRTLLLADVTELDAPDIQRHQIGESLVQLWQTNPEFLRQIDFQYGPAGPEVVVRDAGAFSSWELLQQLPIRQFVLQKPGALDWSRIAALQPRRLVLNQAKAAAYPDLLPAKLSSLREFSLRGSEPPESLRFLASATELEVLDLAGTGISDLSSISNRNLRVLNLTGCAPNNLTPLMRLPLSELVLDPQTAANPMRTTMLRRLRDLEIVRTEDDPPMQTAAEFFRKVDSGFYRAR